MTARRLFYNLCLLTISALTLLLPVAGNASAPPVQPAMPQTHTPVTGFGKLPLAFEANRGQTDARVKFLARGRGYTLFLTPTESVMVLQQREAPAEKDPLAITDPTVLPEPATMKQAVLRMKLDGANPSPAIDGMEQLPGIVNYFIGNDPEQWRTKIPTYARVHYTQTYPGIDLAYYGNQGKLEYDFIVAPGADPNQIKLVFEGASEISVADSGDLLLTTALGEVRLQKPVVYQLNDDGHKNLLAGQYVVHAESHSETLHASRMTNPVIGVQVAAYDLAKPLVIDPTLVYSTYLGANGSEQTADIAVDAAGNAYIAGQTDMVNFPTTSGAFQVSGSGAGDVFITKLNATGSGLVYSTYLGGSGRDDGRGIAVDTAGNAYVTGFTQSVNFPTTSGAFDTTLSGRDGFVTKVRPDGSGLVYSTYLGGVGSDEGLRITVDAADNAYVAGLTTGSFPTTSGAFQTTYGGGSEDAIVTKLNATGSGLVYSTYLGGAGRERAHGIAVDAVGNTYVTGFTTGSFPTTSGAFQTTYGGDLFDGFVTKVNSTGSALVYSTYLGGSLVDQGLGIAVDGTHNAYVTGLTDSINFPKTSGAFDTTISGRDAFVTKVNPTGSALIYSTYIGGSSNDAGNSIAVDTSGKATLIGGTVSNNFPTTSGALQSTYGGGAQDVVITTLDATGSALAYSTYLGGNDLDLAGGIAVDLCNVYVTGTTVSNNFPTTSGAFQTTYNGGSSDGFVTKITCKPIANAGPDQNKNEGTLVTLDGSGSSGGSLTYAWTKVAGPLVALTGANTVSPTFTAPMVPAAGTTVTFELVVTEAGINSDPDSVNVHITNVNQPPVADAGSDQTVQEGSQVMLDGTGSYDPDVETITYQWTQILGPAVISLNNANTAHPTFTAPTVGPAGDTIVFDLTVTDPHNVTGSDSVSIHVTNVNQTPTANAGPDQTVVENTLVTLNGTGSNDPDLDTLQFTWTQTVGPSVTLTGGTTANPTFTAPLVGAGGDTLTFQLVVSDGQASSAEDTVNIHVRDTNDPPVCTLAQPSVASLWPPNHTMVPVTIMGVTDPNNQAVTITFTAVTQDEPVNGLGDGDTSPDAAVSGNQILLRAERAGTGNGRVYVVQFTASDGQGGSCNGVVSVGVPHSKKDAAGDSGQFFNSFLP